jgi:hypothetical protein
VLFLLAGNHLRPPLPSQEADRVAIFDRIRRNRTTGEAEQRAQAPIAPHLLPDVNQRVTVTMGEHVPVPSRVEDRGGNLLELAFPALPLEFGDQVVVTWERDSAWFSMDTRVLGLDEHAAVPTIRVDAAGRPAQYDERRRDVRRAVSLPIELRVIRARALRPGRELNTFTVEVSSNAVRFATTAPFAPGDLLEARVKLGDGPHDTVGARIRIIRVDAVTGSWRSTCTATFDEILRSDRARIIAFADSERMTTARGQVDAAAPTTADGVGGRDQPQDLGNLDNVVEWLRRREP